MIERITHRHPAGIIYSVSLKGDTEIEIMGRMDDVAKQGSHQHIEFDFQVEIDRDSGLANSLVFESVFGLRIN